MNAPKPNTNQVLRRALDCIYAVRNSVIHHAEEPPALTVVNRVLKGVLKEFWVQISP